MTAQPERSIMTDFDLHALVRSVTETSGLFGPRDIAARVVSNVPDAEVRAALALTLVPFVREELRRLRGGTSLVTAVANGNSGRSSKVRAIREQWRRALAGQFHIGGGQWQVLADCSYDNVVYLAEERRQIAKQNAAAADVFDALAAEMRKRKSARVADLPQSFLAEVLSHEAAA